MASAVSLSPSSLDWATPSWLLPGRLKESDYLKRLGASEVIDRSVLSGPGRLLAKERWAGAIDSVGSHTLANVCASTRYGGTVAACGLAQGMRPSSCEV